MCIHPHTIQWFFVSVTPKVNNYIRSTTVIPKGVATSGTTTFCSLIYVLSFSAYNLGPYLQLGQQQHTCVLKGLQCQSLNLWIYKYSMYYQN